jgi:hypothetical protein
MIHSTLNTRKRCINIQLHNYKILREEDFKEYNFTLESSKNTIVKSIMKTTLITQKVIIMK